MRAETVGEIETESKVLVVRRIRQTFYLAASDNDWEAIERVLGVYADRCPVACSVRECIEITSYLDLTPA